MPGDNGEIAGGPDGLALFGGLRVTCGGRDVTAELPGRQGRTLVAYLALHRERAVGRDELVDVLWPSQPPAAPDAALSSVLAKVRRALGAGAIDGRGALRLLAPPAGAIDVEAVAGDVERADGALAAGDPATALHAAEAALAVLARPLLPDLDGDWIEDWRRRLDELAPRALEIAAEAALASEPAQLPAAERAARELVAHHPFREAGYALLMRAQAGRGNVAEALRTFEHVRVLLRDELGTAPSRPLLELHERLLREDAPPPAAAPARASAPPPATAQMIDGAFVGREDFSRRLRERWDACRAGPTGLVFLAGEAGVGKTRLCAEFAGELHREGAIVLYGRADEESLLPHQPFVEALRHLLAGGGAGVTAAAERDREILWRLLPDLAPREPGGAVSQHGDETLRYRLFEAVAGLLRAATDGAPLLLILDDLHWADKPTLLLLRHLLRHPELERVLVIGTFRDAEVGAGHPLADLLSDVRRDRRLDRLALEGLDHAATRELVTHRLQRDVTPEFVGRLHEQTKGNAFFIEETVRSLLDGGLADGDVVTEAALERLGVPEGAAEIVGRRVGRLSALAAEVLVAAAVAGRDFRLEIVAAVVAAPAERVMAALEEALAAGLVVEEPDRVDAFAFSHALVREVLYDQLSVSRRVRLHQAVAEALESAARSRPVNPAELAHHFLLARHFTGSEPARRYAIAAGDHATRLLAYEEAVEHYRTAVALFEDDDERGEVLLALGRAQWRAGSDEARETFRSAAAAAARHGDADQLARAALGHSARYHESGYAGTRGRELLEEALAALPPGDGQRRCLLLTRLAENVAFGTSQHERATELSAEALAMARRIGDDTVVLAAIMARHATLLHVRHLDERLRLSEEFMQLRADHNELLAERHQWRIYDLLEGDELARAVAEQPRLEALAEQLRQPQWHSIAAGWRGVWAELEGDVEQAERCMEKCLEHGRRAGMKHALSTWAAKQLMLRYREGRLGELAPVVDRLVHGADVRKTGWHSAYGWILATVGDEAAAREIYAAELAGRSQALPQFWLVNMAMLSELCAGLGDADGARALYAELAPFAARTVVVVYASCWGPVERYLALLAATAGDEHLRERHARAALARTEAMRAPLLSAELRARHADLLAA